MGRERLTDLPWSIPASRHLAGIEQPQGRDWRHFSQVTLPWIGAIAILGRAAGLPVRSALLLGGSLAHSDPAGDPPAAFLALDGSIVAKGPNGAPAGAK